MSSRFLGGAAIAATAWLLTTPLTDIEREYITAASPRSDLPLRV